MKKNWILRFSYWFRNIYLTVVADKIIIFNMYTVDNYIYENKISNIYIKFKLPIHNSSYDYKWPFYISNHTLHTGLKINTLEDTEKSLYKRFRSQLTHHTNPLISMLNSDTILGVLLSSSQTKEEMVLWFEFIIKS